MEKKKKQYQRPMVEKVNLRVTESVLTACKTAAAISQPTKVKSCQAGPLPKCELDTGS